MDIPIFTLVCMNFYFKNKNEMFGNYGSIDTLIFVKQDRIFELNFETGRLKTRSVYKEVLTKQPEFFLMDDKQHCAVIASQEDGIYINLENDEQTDLDKLYKISNIKEIIYDQEESYFYILANKFDDKLGFFILRINQEDPNDWTFIMKVKNKLDIGDADIFILRDEQQKYKELVVSYKTIFLNTYNIIVIDLTKVIDD